MPRTFFEDGLSMRRADCELFSRIRLKWRPIVVPEFRVDPESTPPEKRIEFLREEDAHVVLDDALRLGADLVVPLDSIHLRGAIIFIAFRDDYFSAPVRIVISGDRMALPQEKHDLILSRLWRSLPPPSVVPGRAWALRHRAR